MIQAPEILAGGSQENQTPNQNDANPTPLSHYGEMEPLGINTYEAAFSALQNLEGEQGGARTEVAKALETYAAHNKDAFTIMCAWLGTQDVFHGPYQEGTDENRLPTVFAALHGEAAELAQQMWRVINKPDVKPTNIVHGAKGKATKGFMLEVLGYAQVIQTRDSSDTGFNELYQRLDSCYSHLQHDVPLEKVDIALLNHAAIATFVRLFQGLGLLVGAQAAPPSYLAAA